MKCRTHPERDAVAVCVRCWRPLCHECGVEVCGKISCKERCEEDQLRIEYLDHVQREKNEEVSRSVGPAMGIGFGAMLLFVGYLGFRSAETLDSDEMRILAALFAGIGLLLVLLAVATFFSKRNSASK